MSSAEATLKEGLRLKVEALCDRVEAGTLGIVQGADFIEKELQAQGKLFLGEPIDPRRVGWSPRNRDEYGGSASQAMDLISIIVHEGCSPEKMKDALLEQEAPGQRTIEEFNRLQAMDNPLMAPVEPNTIDYGSLACGHTYQGFRAFLAGLPHEDERCTVDGKLSLDKLAARDPLYAKFCRDGVPCKVSPSRPGRS